MSPPPPPPQSNFLPAKENLRQPGAHHGATAGTTARSPIRGGLPKQKEGARAFRRQPTRYRPRDTTTSTSTSAQRAQVLDEGRLTDGRGKTVDFSNTVVILTSNLGAEHLRNASGPALEQAKEAVVNTARGHFRPEFLNRLDETVVFSPLSPGHLHRVVRLQAMEVGRRLRDKDIGLTITDAACAKALAESHNPEYGARPMRRYLERNIITPLSRRIIAGELPDHSVVTADGPTPTCLARDGEAFVFTVEGPDVDGDERAAKMRRTADPNRA